MSHLRLVPPPSEDPEELEEHWLTKIAREADEWLRAQDPRHLGPAARRLLGYDKDERG